MKKDDNMAAKLQDSKNKRKQILDAAYLVFSRKGFHRATVDEIIALADTGKGTVYNYFVNKERLFYTLVQERSAPFEARLRSICAEESDPLRKIHILTREFLRFYSQNADLWRVLLHEMRAFGTVGYSAFSPEQQEKYREIFEEILAVLESVIREGMDKRVIKICNSKQAAYGLFSAIIAIVLQQLVGDDSDKAADNIANTFLFGIAER